MQRASRSFSLVFADIAKLTSEILQCEVPRVVVDDAEYRRDQLAHGHRAQMADMLASLFGATRAGEFDVVDPTAERILGRKRAAMKAVLSRLLLKKKAQLMSIHSRLGISN